MTATYDVCCIGNAIVDVIANADDAFLAQEGIAKGRMTLIDEDRADALYAKMAQATEMSGGSAANTAAAIASLGGRVAYMGRVRDDQLGKIFCHDTRAIGVHYANKPAWAGPATARCLIFVTPDAQRSMNTYLGACAEFGPNDLEPDLLKNASITYLEGYLYDRPAAQQAFRDAATIVKDNDRKLALTLSDVFCVERHRAAFHILINEAVDILFANHQELMALYETSDLEAAMAEAAKHCPTVAITMSEKGSTILARGEKTVIAAEPCPRVVDTTGAGDAYAAGFLYGYSRNLPLAACGKIGAIAASEAISHFGPRPQTNLRELIHKKSAA